MPSPAPSALFFSPKTAQELSVFKFQKSRNIEEKINPKRHFSSAAYSKQNMGNKKDDLLTLIDDDEENLFSTKSQKRVQSANPGER